jgi:hypothetical protein
VDYKVKRPSLRVNDLTWRPYGYYRRIRINKARERCLRFKGLYIIEAKSSTQKRKKQMEFDTDSYDILIDNCCSHSLTNCKEDFIEPPIKSKVKVRGYNGHTESTMVGTVKWKIQLHITKHILFISSRDQITVTTTLGPSEEQKERHILCNLL